MAILEANPFVMRNAVIQIGADDFVKSVSRAELVPAGGTTTFKGLEPSAVYSFAQAATWTLELEAAQDWTSATSLSRYLFDHQGENVDVTLNPNVATEGTTSWSMTVSITAGAIGGVVDAVAVFTVSLGVVGAPVPTLVPVTPLAKREAAKSTKD